MQYRKFGSLDWEVSALGFGCMRLPTKKSLFWKSVDVPEAIRIIRHAIDHGVNYVDTAWGYHAGKSESVVGLALKDGYRDKVHLVTKLPMWRVRKTTDVDYFLTKQLQRLQTDHLDIYLFHGMNKKRFEQLKELQLIKRMEEAKASGRIKHIGFSFHDPYPIFKEIIDYYSWDMCQIQYNYVDQDTQATTRGLEYAASKGIAVVIMEPVKGGHLVHPPPEAAAILERSVIKRTPVDWALQFVWNRPEVSCVLSGMGSFQMVEENLASVDRSGAGKLTAEERAILDEVSKLYQQKILVPCSACEYCLPCPQGVMIPRNFAVINNLSGSKDLAKAMREYKKITKQNGGADRCAKCEKCLALCPQKINIPAELEKVYKVMVEGHTIADTYSSPK